MLKKMLVAVFAAVLGGTAFAIEDITQVDFNFYSDGDIVLEGELPAGVTFGPKSRFRDPKLKGYGFPIRFDVNKVQSLNMKFTVKGNGGKIVLSIIRYSRDEQKHTKALPLTCKVFEFCDEPSKSVPCVAKRWKSMMSYEVEPGDSLTLKAEFEKPTE